MHVCNQQIFREKAEKLTKIGSNTKNKKGEYKNFLKY